ncbi:MULTISPECIES: hypothetical protein [Sinorhizobium]|nr:MULTISPECIES: hypothetical protein [Sinorhizobium]MDX0106661.1 hypothetical protein [Sinorhizobium meliloti]MDX0182526.1 hypothetical protein [Sinorhizobium meliloti]MDX0408849.1 hypothetical protein [Sinorhizobium medicae]MDX0420856.1 hypothetical protein [Sinorhizobium medicae]MDX1035282.1 hypothetical protein [Sinorhizobium medicae]
MAVEVVDLLYDFPHFVAGVSALFLSFIEERVLMVQRGYQFDDQLAE